MRENRTYGSEGGEPSNGSLPYPYHEKVIVLEDLLREDEGELAETVSFSEMQKIIGIKR